VGVVPKHYMLRTSRVIGEGENFVRSTLSMAERCVQPAVVADQIGRLTFTEGLVAAIIHLRISGAPYGTYNVTNTGRPGSWADVARRVYAYAGRPASDVTDTTTAEYYGGQHAAPRPLNSVLDLAKLEATGFTPRDQWAALDACLHRMTP
jgi:dTDP-4-dehydrorhamnose 3,5-epimerase/reductase